MAQSKIGGTKSFIHGKVGSEVYYTDHDLDGEIIQVVKSVPDTVRNPRTAAQNRGRIIMATLYKAVGALTPLVNHSFEGYVAGRPSLAHFFSVNYKLIKQDIESHPDANYEFGLVQWKGLYPRPGAFVIAEGPLTLGSYIEIYYESTRNIICARIKTPKASKTISDLKNNLNMEIGDFLTIVVITSDGKVQYQKLTWKYEGDTSLVISPDTFFDVFKVDGTLPISFLTYTIGKSYFLRWHELIVGGSIGIVLTKIIDGVQIRSSSTMKVCKNVGSSYNEVLATYPKGDKFYY